MIAMIVVNYEDCKGCGDCVDACPVGAILLQNNTVFIDQELCDGCQTCVDACPQDALAYALNEPELDRVLLIPEIRPAELISVQGQPGAKSLRGTALPALSSLLLWTGREIVPRLADFALSYLDRWLQSSQSTVAQQNMQIRSQRLHEQHYLMSGVGRRHRQRQRRKLHIENRKE